MHVDHFAMRHKSKDLQPFRSKGLLMLLQENTDLGIHLGALRVAQTISNERTTGPKFLAAMKLLKRLRMEGHAIIHRKTVMILCLMITKHHAWRVVPLACHPGRVRHDRPPSMGYRPSLHTE